MALAVLPFVLGGCHELGLRTMDSLRGEREEILAERKLIIAQLDSLQIRVTDLEQQVQELQDKTIVSCFNLLAKDDPLIRTQIEEDCKAICEKVKDTPDSYSSTTEGTFDP